MYQIHLYPDPEDPALRAGLLRETAMAYASRLCAAGLTAADLTVSRSSSGKPFFTSPAASGICFSISHSCGLWACVLGPGLCGLDIQQMRSCRQDAIACRYFTASEQAYVQQEGLSGFYRIWTRREALAKYTGSGFFGMAGELPAFTEPAQGSGLRLRDHVVWRGRQVWFHEISLETGFAAVWCSEEKKGDAEIVRRAEYREEHKEKRRVP